MTITRNNNKLSTTQHLSFFSSNSAPYVSEPIKQIEAVMKDAFTPDPVSGVCLYPEWQAEAARVYAIIQQRGYRAILQYEIERDASPSPIAALFLAILHQFGDEFSEKSAFLAAYYYYRAAFHQLPTEPVLLMNLLYQHVNKLLVTNTLAVYCALIALYQDLNLNRKNLSEQEIRFKEKFNSADIEQEALFILVHNHANQTEKFFYLGLIHESGIFFGTPDPAAAELFYFLSSVQQNKSDRREQEKDDLSEQIKKGLQHVYAALLKIQEKVETQEKLSIIDDAVSSVSSQQELDDAHQQDKSDIHKQAEKRLYGLAYTAWVQIRGDIEIRKQPPADARLFSPLFFHQAQICEKNNDFLDAIEWYERAVYCGNGEALQSFYQLANTNKLPKNELQLKIAAMREFQSILFSSKDKPSKRVKNKNFLTVPNLERTVVTASEAVTASDKALTERDKFISILFEQHRIWGKNPPDGIKALTDLIKNVPLYTREDIYAILSGKLKLSKKREPHTILLYYAALYPNYGNLLDNLLILLADKEKKQAYEARVEEEIKTILQHIKPFLMSYTKNSQDKLREIIAILEENSILNKQSSTIERWQKVMAYILVTIENQQNDRDIVRIYEMILGEGVKQHLKSDHKGGYVPANSRWQSIALSEHRSLSIYKPKSKSTLNLPAHLPPAADASQKAKQSLQSVPALQKLFDDFVVVDADAKEAPKKTDEKEEESNQATPSSKDLAASPASRSKRK
ncbi:MAG TPA: hypothetical protein VHZ76_03730 [Gammaproteobacteria bacterium]|jgi:TPR repeat protein|nr:hypothetical protein [Gammaproteobacteria bacterium]